MAFLNNLKPVAELAEQVSHTIKGVAENINDKVTEAKEEKAKQQQREVEIASGLYEQDGKLIVSSIDGMKRWLSNLGKDTTPAIMETLQNQLSVLNVVQSPTLTGMAVDNMILCLDKAVKQAETNEEKVNIREAFASMLQSYVFFTEANIRCASKNRQDESKELLTQAGAMLSDAVLKTAQLVTEGPAAIARTTIMNIFDSEEMRSGYVKKLFAWIGNKKEFEQKLTDFYKTLEMLFKTLDNYSDILGKSILINGMLSRYRCILVERYKEQKTEDFRNRLSTIDPKKLSALTDALSNIVSAKGINLGNAAKALGVGIGLAADAITHNYQCMDVDAFCVLQDAIDNDIQAQEPFFTQLNTELNTLKAEQDNISILKRSLKKEYQVKIDAKQREVDKAAEALESLKTKRNDMRELFPDSYATLKDIKDYEQQLIAIEEKF